MLHMWSMCCSTTVPVRSDNLSVTGAAGQAVGAGLPFYAGVAASGAQLAWQIAAVDLDSQADCLAKFGSNKWHGAALFSGIVLDRLLA
jgi:4-hydroxybenzoate polyprenyltransferase